MSPAIIVATISALISLCAATVAGIALWKTHFSAFRAVAAVGDLSRRIFPITNSGQRWYIASFCVPVSITNAGARPGLIRGFRLALRFLKLPIPGHVELIPAKWDIEPGTFEREAKNRFTWLDDDVHASWMATVVLSRDTVTKTLVFETRWEKPVVQDVAECRLEMITDSTAEWTTLATWQFPMRGLDWSQLVESGTCITIRSPDAAQPWEETRPDDLHKYTGPDAPLPSRGVKSAPSYLDYPTEESK